MSDMTSAVAIDLIDNLIGMIEDNQENDYDAAFRMAIESLKAQAERTEERTETHGVCLDAISRQDAIDAMGKVQWAKVRLMELPSAQPEQRWISCSERLPEVGTYVLISKKALGFRSNLPSVCAAHRTHDPRSGKEEWNDMLFGKLDDGDVLAWMPLPEPYQEGEQDE